ncbi:nucleotide sugar dehydrogenase [Paenibacillus montanisoli]|uniref:UDP-N-acetyl-D-glucosamine dehydrogenase n=1 Tax=Paenibacillus montanisoli TaxID=2081970 RepID=A0A328U1P6_9BACL|nr:nucleotide sugar dehydrogenase [Paenibacillus montanisoli]RAP76559.1 UDP-N-acetyl-D-glucosamine dehydrogenase [Paenibacillus montanisoli]
MKEIDSTTIGNGREKVAIIGLGFVGLPLAVAFMRKGFPVIGIDMDERKIRAIGAGKSYIQDISDDEIERAVSEGDLFATTDYSVLSSADAIIVCVPTPLSNENAPDLTFLINVTRQLVPVIKLHQLVVIESSTYPGTTKEIVQPILEQSGLEIGRQLHLAYSPERVDPGNRSMQMNEIPKVVSGITERCLERVSALYERVFDRIVAVSSTDAAELTKLLENTYRLVNISFINEFARLCDALHINVWEVIQAAATKPYGYSPFYPGPGIGGHCIPVDPLYLQWKAEQKGASSRFIEIAHTVNESMPAYIVDRVQAHLPSNKPLTESRILVYGVTYKKDTADMRESMASPIIRLLLDQGAELRYHDPYIDAMQVNDGTKLNSVALTAEEIAGADCVLILVDHSVLPAEFILEHSKYIFDTRNIIKSVKTGAKLVKLGDGAKS